MKTQMNDEELYNKINEVRKYWEDKEYLESQFASLHVKRKSSMIEKLSALKKNYETTKTFNAQERYYIKEALRKMEYTKRVEYNAQRRNYDYE